jgi:hypothetical protein
VLQLKETKMREQGKKRGKATDKLKKYNSGESKLGLRQPIKTGGPAKKSKFPDHSGDGKITKKDILMAKGIIPKKKMKRKA